MIERFIRDVVFGFAIGMWATDEGWVRNGKELCGDCGRNMYRRGGDFACTEELVKRWRKRSRR